jgi:hypothetical protein
VVAASKYVIIHDMIVELSSLKCINEWMNAKSEGMKMAFDKLDMFFFETFKIWPGPNRIKLFGATLRRHDIQHNDTQHDDI